MHVATSWLGSRKQIAALTAIALLGACHGDYSYQAPAGTGAPQTYALSASVSGLTGSGLVLALGGSTVPVSGGASSVALAAGLSSGDAYSVSVQTQPAGQTCSVANGTGTIGTANVANVVVTCSSQGYSLGGTINGLSSSGLVLANGADTLTVAANATSFSMPGPVAATGSYQVTVQTQPTGLTCSVAQGSGAMPASNVSSVVVTCTSQPFTLGGTITGLGNASGLVLANGTETLTVAANATSFVLATAVASGATYSVVVQSSPAGLTCGVVNGSGTMGASNVTTVAVTCSNQAFTLGGTLSGLSQTGLVLANGSDSVAVTAGSTSFTLPTAVPAGSSYHVTVQAQPAGATCTVSQGSGTMPAGDVGNVTVACASATYTIGGTISGLTAGGLVLLNNGGDATPIAANATQFTMTSGVSSGSSYAVSVGTQPYGITVHCAVSAGSGTASADVTTVAVTCTAGAPTRSQVLGYFDEPFGMTFDAQGNLYVADRGGGSIKKLTYDNGSFGQPVVIAMAGLSGPWGVTIDAGLNLFVADQNATVLYRLPYTAGVYGSPAAIGSGFSYPSDVKLDAGGNLYVADAGNNVIKKLTVSNGTFGSPTPIASGFQSVYALVLDAAGNLFAPDYNNNAVKEFPYSNGAYGPAVSLGSGYHQPQGIALDAGGNLFVADGVFYAGSIFYLANSSGTYSAPTTVSSGLYPYRVELDGSRNLYAANGSQVYRLPNSGGNNWGPSSLLGSGLANPRGIALDANRNLYVADTNSAAIKMFPYSNGGYGASVTLASVSSGQAVSVAVDQAGNVFYGLISFGGGGPFGGNSKVMEIPKTNGSFGTPVAVASGLTSPYALAIDTTGNLYFGDSNSAWKIPLSSGSYGAPVSIASGVGTVFGMVVDASGNLFASNTGGSVKEIPFNAGSYGAPVTVASGFSNPQGLGVDAAGNLYLADTSNNALKMIPLSNGSYGAPVTLSTAFKYPVGVALDASGRVYVDDINSLQVFAPAP